MDCALRDEGSPCGQSVTEGQLAARGSSSVYITAGAWQALEFIISDSESQESHLVLIQQLGDATSCGSRVSPKT